jgi:hypothetical protein
MATHENIGQVEIRAIQDVERLEAELRIERLTDRGVLDYRDVDVLISRPGQDIAAGVPETAERRDRESRRVEPLLRGRIGELGIAQYIRPVVGAEAQDRTAGVAVVEIGEQRDGERTARLEGPDAERLLAAQQASAAQRQVIGVAQRKAVPQIVVR